MSKRMINILLTIIIVINIALLTVFVRSQSKIYQAENEMIDLVNYDYQVKQVQQFYWTTIDETFFALDFIDQDDIRHYAIVTQEGGDMYYFTPEELISQQEAEAITRHDLNPNKLLRTRLGMREGEPIWEVTTKNDNQTLTYYYINAKDGHWVEKIENI